MLKKLIVLHALGFLSFFPTTASAASYSLTPELSAVCTYSAEVNLDPAGSRIDGSDIVMFFDPSKLDILSVDEGTLFPSYLGKQIDTTNGKITLSGIASLSTPITSKGVFAKIHFKIKDNAPLDQTALKFDFDPNDPLKTIDTNIIERGTVKDVLTQVTDFNFLIKPTPLPTPAVIPITKNFQVNASEDDMNEHKESIDRIYGLNSKELWIGRADTNKSFTGLRFNNISIPKGSKIKAAKLMFYTYSDQIISLAINVTGDNSINSVPFSATSLPSKRPKTVASLFHVSNSLWKANTWNEFKRQDGVDFRAIIQEIIDQPLWEPGNSLSLIMQGFNNSWDRKFVSSYDRDPQQAPKLTITYE